MTVNRFQIRAIARKLLWIIGYVINDAIITPCRSLYRTYFLPRLIKHPDGQHTLRILHHDAHFMVVDKPANVNIDENKGRPFGRVTVETLIKARFPHYHLRNVHQLDYGTSGVYVIALTPESASIACSAFRVRTVKKTYLAILEGHVAEEEVTITRSIGIDPLDPKRMHLDGIDQKVIPLI
jgi:23S rRNA-/tRNA-specific pseudouridylate synthase